MLDIVLKIFALLAVYQLKHFLADFPLQNEYMLRKFKVDGWKLPLACHAGVHALFTFLIASVLVKPEMAGALAAFDFTVHFAMDRYKASPFRLGKYKALSASEFMENKMIAESTAKVKPEHILEAKRKLKWNTYFWYCLGLDQMVHHLTHYVIIFFLIK